MITLTPWERLLTGEAGYVVKPVRDTEAAHFYWCTEIKTTEISTAYLGGVHGNKISPAVGPAVFVDRECKGCSKPVYAFSRSDAVNRVADLQQFTPESGRHRAAWADPRICHECRSRIYDAYQAAPREEGRRHAERLRELQYMPYAEYLRTPEWRATRDEAVKRARGCCQTCSSTDRLNVHHRTYLRRGHEYLSDLIVLCEPCHKIFHDNGRLADGGRAAA